MRAAFTWYLPGKPEQTVWFENLPAMPRCGDTVHFHDRAWTVTHVALVPDSDEEITPADTDWHLECSVR